MLDKNLLNTLTRVATQQITSGVNFKKPRLKQIQKFEDMYANKVKKMLKNRFNIPLPILSGYVDTLKSKIDDSPIVNFEKRSEGDLKVAKKVSAAWEVDSGEDKGNWAFTDRLVKTLAIFSGRGIYKIFSESDPEYSNHLEAVDYYDFYCEPQGGPDLNKHLFCGQQNIFKTKKDLIEGAKAGIYDKAAVALLLFKGNPNNDKKIQKETEFKFNRYRALGLDANTNDYVGEMLFNLTEHCMTYEGVKYVLLLEESQGIAVRANRLEEVSSLKAYPFVSWATHEDAYNFWSKGPCDDVFPIAEAMRIIFNESLDNLQKRNWGQRAVDTSIFPDPSKLAWQPDGIVAGNAMGKSLSAGVYQFETPDTSTITINLINFVDNFLGTKTGITPSSQGAGDKNTKVGIYMGEMQQVADRIGLTNKIYKGAYAQLGKRYLYGLKDHLNESMAVKYLGESGVEWDELIKYEISDLNIKITGGQDELKFNELQNQRRDKALTDILANPNLSTKINASWAIEQKLRAGGYDLADIKTAIDINNYGDEDILSEASKACEDIIKGKKVKINRGATPGFIQKIIDFAHDTEIPMPKFDALIEYATSHVEIAAENMFRKAKSMIAEKTINEAMAPSSPGEAPMPDNLAPTAPVTPGGMPQ